jgi:lactate dehydrogenase-like 2-hydroxyacid dehydrogenase
MTETKMAKSGWSAYQDARPGDFTVYETPGVSRTRTEVFDVADHAVVLVMDVAVKIGDMETKSRTAGKYLLTEPDEPVDPVQKARYKTETKPVNRKFTVGGKEYTADTVREVSVEGMLSSRTWLSKELGEGVFLLMEDGDGKPLMRLVDYGRGR